VKQTNDTSSHGGLSRNDSLSQQQNFIFKKRTRRAAGNAKSHTHTKHVERGTPLLFEYTILNLFPKWTVTLQNGAKKEVFGPRKEEVTGICIKLHDEELNNVYS
jgi:hypothetical protein